MDIVCAWCKKGMGEKPPLDNDRTTHSICPDCVMYLKGKEEKGNGKQELQPS